MGEVPGLSLRGRLEMHVELREGEFYAVFGEDTVDFLVDIVEHAPILFGTHPDTHGDVHAAVGKGADHHCGRERNGNGDYIGLAYIPRAGYLGLDGFVGMEKAMPEAMFLDLGSFFGHRVGRYFGGGNHRSLCSAFNAAFGRRMALAACVGIMALGFGISSTVGGRDANENSFGLIALCSIGPMIAVMALALASGDGEISGLGEYATVSDSLAEFGMIILNNIGNVALALALIVIFFMILQFTVLKLPRQSLIQIGIGK